MSNGESTDHKPDLEYAQYFRLASFSYRGWGFRERNRGEEVDVKRKEAEEPGCAGRLIWVPIG